MRTLWRGVLWRGPSPISFTENGTDPTSLTMVGNSADSRGLTECRDTVSCNA
jgi:hypothetical protein